MSFLPDLPLWARVAAATVLTYAYVVALLRVSGKRTVASLTTFDWILNVAMGSLVAVAMTTPDKFWVANLSILLVVVLQFIVAKAAYHSRAVARAVTAEPTLLVHQGRFLRDAMARVRVNEDEIASALRKAGITELSGAGAVVMETGGTLCVIASDTVTRSRTTDFALRELHGMALGHEGD